MAVSVDVVALQSRIVDLEKAGKRAGAITAIVGLVAAIIGAVIGAFGLYVQFNDELRNWEALKQVHSREVSGREVFDHAALSPEEIAIIVEQLNMPDFSIFATKDELPDTIDQTQFIRISDIPAIGDLALKSDLPNLDAYAKRSDLPNFSEFAKRVDFVDVAMKSDITPPPDMSIYLRNGDRITVQGVSGKYLFDLDSRNRDEIDVIMSSAQDWRIRKSN